MGSKPSSWIPTIPSGASPGWNGSWPRRAAPKTRGYNEDEVDAFLELVAAQLQSGPGVPPQSGFPGFPALTTARSHARDTTLESKGRRFLNGVVDIVRSITD